MTVKNSKITGPLIEFSRARAYYLYSATKRYVDLDLCGGQAPWGHAPRSSSNELKKVISKKLWGNINSREQTRFLRIFSRLFPQWKIKSIFFRSVLQEQNAHRSVCIIEGMSDTEQDQKKPLLAQNLAFLWRPYSGITLDEFCKAAKKQYYLTPLIPFDWEETPLFLCDREETTHTSLETATEKKQKIEKETLQLAKFTCLNSVLLAGLSYALLLLQRYGSSVRPVPESLARRKDLVFLEPGTSFPAGSRRLQLELPSGQWQQKGIYITMPEMENSCYQEIRRILLDYGFYLSLQQGIITTPPYMTVKELKNWDSVLQKLRPLLR